MNAYVRPACHEIAPQGILSNDIVCRIYRVGNYSDRRWRLFVGSDYPGMAECIGLLDPLQCVGKDFFRILVEGGSIKRFVPKQRFV